MKLYNFCGGRAPRIAVEIMILGLLLASSANAATLAVCPSGCAYSVIQDAINASISGDTIEVQSGIYYENVNVNKQLTLRGIGMPVVDANESGSAITLSADGIILEGFTIMGSRTGSFPYPMEAGIKVISNNNMLSGNNASDNKISYGIYLYYSSGNTLSNNNVSDNSDGIFLDHSGNNTLNGNNVSKNNGDGISLYSSSNNTLVNNIMIENRYNFDLYGTSDSDYDNRIDTSNLVNNKPIYYIKGAMNIIYDSSTNAGTFYCISCVNVTVKDLDLNTNDKGIYFWNTTRSKIQNINVSNNNRGILLDSSSNNIMSGNNANFNGEYSNDHYFRPSGNGFGIHLSYSSNNTLVDNSANSNFGGLTGTGISLYSSSNNTLIGNNALDNTGGRGKGINLGSSRNNTLIGNNVSSNSYYGIDLDSSSNNTLIGNNASNNRIGIYLYYSSGNNKIYHNNFRNNTDQAIDNTSTNSWHSGYPTGGNYWSDYTGVDIRSGLNQDQPGSDGIGDTPYNISGSSSTDRYPLMVPFSVGMKGDLNNNGESADAGDLILMKRASIGEIIL